MRFHPLPLLSSRVRSVFAGFIACGGLVATAHGQSAAPPARQALSYEPIQPGIEYDRPEPGEIDRCTVEPEKVGETTAWVVKSPSGQLLRRFADTNGDNRVDVWSYFKNGLEVYRDVDSNHNKKADQYRWFHTAGTRWGVDSNEDGRIDSWRQITPFETAEVAIHAMQRGDSELFASILPTSSELGSLGLSTATTTQLQKDIAQAQKEFAKFAASQKTVSKTTRFVDIGAGRPALIPAGTDGSTKDVLLFENIAALVDNQGKPEQVFLGAMVQIGPTWKVLGLPQTGDTPPQQGPFALADHRSVINDPVAANGPSEEMQKLMTELERLDAEGDRGNAKEQLNRVKRRAQILHKLADLSTRGEERELWQRQLADMLSASVQMQQNFGAIDELRKLVDQLKKENASKDAIAHIEFRRLWAEYGKAQLDPKSDYPKVQAAWLESLEGFAKTFPTSPETAEAMLQLGMSKEFAGEEKEAIEWYQKLVSDFGSSPAGKKAEGAIRRLDSIGKPFPLQATEVRGGQVNLAGYRNKFVLVHYWATWCEPCKADIKMLKELYPKYSRQGFEIVGVNLDNSVDQARSYLGQEKLPWRHVYDEGGLDGRLANEMGVLTLPLMILVDDKGNVVNRNVHVSELEAELKRVLR